MAGALLSATSQGASHLDVQSVTSGADGTAGAQDRRRGYVQAAIGGISTGTSKVGGTTITDLYWNENTGIFFYHMSITGAPNSGWTSISINGPNGLKVLTRASGTYSGGTWQWATADVATANAFGGNGANVTVAFD